MLNERNDIPNLHKSRNKRRYAMPQIASNNVDHFLKWLKEEHGIRHTRRMEEPDTLIPTQKEFNHDKIDHIASKQGGGIFKKPILVSKNNYIIDGHHRWAGAHKAGKKIMTVRISDDIDDILEKIKGYNKASTKKVHEMLQERELTQAEENKREEIVKELKNNKSEFQDKYGDNWKSVMYAVATKKAKTSVNKKEDQKESTMQNFKSFLEEKKNKKEKKNKEDEKKSKEPNKKNPNGKTQIEVSPDMNSIDEKKILSNAQ